MNCSTVSTAAHHSVRKTTVAFRQISELCKRTVKRANHTTGFSWRSFRVLSHLSYASNKLGLYHHAIIFILVKCCFLSCLHQVVWSSLHRIASSLKKKKNDLKVSTQSLYTHFHWIRCVGFTCSLLMASESWSAFTLQATSSWAVEAATCLAEEMSFSSLAWPWTEALAASHRLLVAAATIRAYRKHKVLIVSKSGFNTQQAYTSNS